MPTGIDPFMNARNAAIGALIALSMSPLATGAQGRGAPTPPTPPVSAMETMGKIGPIIRDGMLQPVAEFADTSTWIRQRVFIETNFDTDKDGRLDRIHADIVRPGAAEKAGLKVPVIMRGSPYIGPTNGSSNCGMSSTKSEQRARRALPLHRGHSAKIRR
jgi:hypothetical protein